MSARANALADRLEKGAQELAAFAEKLSDSEWNVVVPRDGRTVGVMVHHVANMYPIELDLMRTLTSGKPVAGVTWKGVAVINAKHAHDQKSVRKEEALSLLRKNSKAAAEEIRKLTDQQLDSAAPVSLNEDAPLTAQFIIEDHALRHSYHHLAKIRETLGK